MFCPSCGHDNPQDAVFCGKCGATLLQHAVPVPVPVAVEAVPPAPAPAVWYSGFWRRVGASMLDGLVLGIPFGLAILFVVLRPWNRRDELNAILLVSLVLLMIITSFVYDWLFVALNKGQTPGKKLLHVRVVNATGNVPSLGRAAAREAVKMAMGQVPYVGPIVYLWIIWDKRKQSLYDKIAGTYVVRSGD